MFRSVYSVSLCRSVYCLCVNMYCTVLLPPGVNPVAFNKIYHFIHKILRMDFPGMRIPDNGGENLAISNPSKAHKLPRLLVYVGDITW